MMRRKTEEKITHAALELFLKNGVQKTSIEKIALKAEVAPTTIYRNFRSKENLFRSTIESYTKNQEAINIINTEPTEDVIADLTEIGITLNNILLSNAELAKLVLIELDNNHPLLGEYIRIATASVIEPLTQYFNNAIKKGYIDDVNADLAAVIFYSFFYRNMITNAFRNKDLLCKMDRITIQRFVKLLCFGLFKEENVQTSSIQNSASRPLTGLARPNNDF